MYNLQNSTSVTVTQKPIVNGSEVLNPQEAQDRKQKKQIDQAQRVHQTGHGIVPALVPLGQTTVQGKAVPIPPGSFVAANTATTVTQTDIFGNEHSKLLSNTKTVPVAYYATNAYPAGLHQQPPMLVPVVQRGNPNTPQVYSQPAQHRHN
jgi:hypothetical protein